MMKKMKGKKTYMVAFAAAITVALYYLGHISPDDYTMLMTVYGVGGVAAMRDAIG